MNNSASLSFLNMCFEFCQRTDIFSLNLGQVLENYCVLQVTWYFLVYFLWFLPYTDTYEFYKIAFPDFMSYFHCAKNFPYGGMMR